MQSIYKTIYRQGDVAVMTNHLAENGTENGTWYAVLCIGSMCADDTHADTEQEAVVRLLTKYKHMVDALSAMTQDAKSPIDEFVDSIGVPMMDVDLGR